MEEYIYVLYDSHINISQSDNYNHIIYDMISMLLKHLIFLELNGIYGVTINKSNFVIKTYLKHNIHHPLDNHNIYYDFQNHTLVFENKMLKPNLESYNEHLINKIKLYLSKINSTTKNHHYTSSDTINVSIGNYNDDYVKRQDCCHISEHFNEYSDGHTNANTICKKSSTRKLKSIVDKSELDVDNIDQNNVYANLTDEKVKELIDELEKKRDAKQVELETQLEADKEKVELLTQMESTINEIKMLERIAKDEEEQNKKIFNSDIRSYFLMREHIPESEISELFINKFKIFKLLEANSDLSISIYDTYDLTADNMVNTYKLYRYIYDSIYSEHDVDDEYVKYIENAEHKDTYIQYIDETIQLL